MSYYPNHNMPPCGRPPQHPLTFGELNYTAEQINAFLGMIPFKADRAEVPEMEKLSDVNYLGHVADPSLLTHQTQPSWALVGSLKSARPYFYYVEGFVPQGYTAGWNDVTPVLGTYDLTADKVSIYDYHLLTEYNVSRNHVHSTRVFSQDWAVTSKFYSEFADYVPEQHYAACSKVNMPGYKEHSFMANKATKEAPFITVDETNEFSFSEAVALVPEEYRFPGMRVTFINSMTRLAETWYFKGGTWENVGNWQKINFGGGEGQLTAEELFRDKFEQPKLTADMAIADEHGNRIPDTYVTRHAVAKFIQSVFNEMFIANPPLIMEGYITPEMLSEEVRNMLAASGATITNLPDGEDITTIHGVLKLSNKQYNAGAYSGLGRQYLRKNLVGGLNVLTQSMMQWPNTIYIIQYDYDLNGAEIKVPEGCTLDFQGGSFSNGNIIGYNTIISANVTKIFNNINFLGTWDINQVYPDWFGVVYNEEVDNGDSLKIAFDLAGISSGKNIKINAGVIYYNPLSKNTDIHSTGVKARLMLQNNCTLTMDDNTFLCVLPREYEGYTAIGAENVTDVHIKGGHIIGSIKTNNRNSGEWCYGICFWNVQNSSIENVESSYHSGDGFNLERRYGSKDTDTDNECKNIIIRNCLADNNGRQGLSIEGGKHIDIIDCKFSNTGVIKRLEPSRGIDIEPGPVNSEACHILIKGCVFENNLGGSILLYGNNKLSATDNLLDINVHDITIAECNCDNFSEQRQIHGGINVYASKVNIEKSSFGLLYINAGEYINVKKNIFTSVIFSNRKINNSTGEKMFPISFVDIINNSISLQYYSEAIYFNPSYNYPDVVNVTNIRFIGNNVSSKNIVTGFVNNSSCKEHILFAKNSLINNREDVIPQIFSSNNTIDNMIFSKKIDYIDGISIGSNNYIRDIYLENDKIIKVTIETTKSCLFDLSISGFWNEVISDSPTIYTISSGYINSELITLRGKSTNHITVGNITNISSLKCSLLIKATKAANFRLMMSDENISSILVESYEGDDFIKNIPKYDWSIIDGKPKWWIENKGLVDIKYLSNNYEFKLDLNNSAAIFDITVENASIFFIIISGYWTDTRINKSCVYCCNINYDGTITIIDYKGSAEIENEYKIGSFEKVSNLKGSFALKASNSIARPTVNIIGNSITDVSYIIESKDVLSELPIGYMKFSNNKPIWWTGEKWVDATGVEV